MKIGIFSDLHAHPHRFGGEIDTATDTHSRLQDCLDVLELTAKDAENTGAILRIFCGDMTHVRGRVAPTVQYPIAKHYAAHHSLHQNFYDILLDGNHDMEARTCGTTSLDVIGLLPHCRVLKDFGCEQMKFGTDYLTIGWVAYDPDVSALAQKVAAVCAIKRSLPVKMSSGEMIPSVFIVHHGIDGVMDNVPETGFGPGSLPVNEFDWCFAGDYHKHKEVIPGRAWSVGAPLQHNFGDANQARGWMRLDTDTRIVEFVENTKAPKFLTFDFKNGAAVLYHAPLIKGNFCRVRAETNDLLDANEKQLLDMGAKAVQKELVRDWAAAERADIDLTMSVRQLFTSWYDGLKADATANLDRARLMLLNTAVLNEAGVA